MLSANLILHNLVGQQSLSIVFEIQLIPDETIVLMPFCTLNICI